MNGIYNQRPIIPVGRPVTTGKTTDKQNVNENSKSFDNILQEEVSKQIEVKFSKHAMERLQSRNISLTKEEISKINHAVSKAAEKGVKETLIIMGNAAFIANVKSKTIITAATDESLKENVFTNIDGAVII